MGDEETTRLGIIKAMNWFVLWCFNAHFDGSQGASVSGAHAAPAADARGAAPTETRSGGTAGCMAWECNIAGAASPESQGCWKVSLISDHLNPDSIFFWCSSVFA